MKTHSAFLVPEQVIRICILYKRFRLTIAVINNFNINFEISFFKQALTSDAYDICFYMLKVYDE